jgi:hygromycin-B 4-O-kinase
VNVQIAEAKAFLREHVAADASEVEILTGGDWSQAFGFTCSEGDFVIRFGRHVDDYQKDLAASKVASERLPIPRVTEIGEALDGYFCISERVRGTMLDVLPPGRLSSTLPSIFALFDGLREADPGFTNPAKSTWAEDLLAVDQETERIHGWHDRMLSSRFGPDTYLRGLDFVRERLPNLPTAKHLIHNDLLHNNVLVGADRIAGVIDWGCAIAGDHLYELATFTLYQPWSPNMIGIEWRKLMLEHLRCQGVNVADFNERLQTYEVHLGLVGMAYCAFLDDDAEFHRVAQRTAEMMER